MAPVTSRIADGKKYGLIFFSGLSKGIFSPREPIHGIVGMLQKIRTLFLTEAICHYSAPSKAATIEGTKG
jgi:hypothetical protein